MHRIDTPTAQKDKFGAGKDGFTCGNPQTGTPATDLDDDYFDMLQEELVSVVEAAGMTLDKSKHNQLLNAILRIGAGAPSIGVPFFWMSTSMPNTVIPEWSNMVFLKFNGATFSATTYPKLALVIPSLTLVDARGEFPRIWDDGRGIDAGRALLSAQGDAIRNITGGVSGRNQTSTANIFGVTDANGALGTTGTGVNSTAAAAAVSTGAADRASSLTFDASKAPGVVTASENRPRNIAFNFLVRAK
ncbi:integrase [Escherichia coli]|uniref:integrase n=1 Tax=Escherichia coli TaxID=562 RepID=UPI0024DFF2D1|nr:integrase [Escherichia coli]WIC11151.1 integrase [Escherichia coli]